MFDPQIHRRQSIRLPGYDYTSAGFYFVTICVQGREALLGDVSDGQMVLNEAGRTVADIWIGLPRRFPNVALDECMVMPNHFHGILQITDPNTNGTVGAPLAAPQYHTTKQTNQGAASGATNRGAASSVTNQGAASDATNQGAASGATNRGAASSATNRGAASSATNRGAASSATNQGAASSAPTLGNVVRVFKSISAIGVNKIIGRSGQPFWQRNYYERIIRNENELHNVRQYIRDNPLNWATDPENPAATP